MNKTLCRNGHDKQITGVLRGNRCRECSRLHHLNWGRKNKEKVMKNVRQWNINHPDRVKNARWKQYGIINPDGSWFTQVDFDRLYQIQQGRCSICKKHQTELSRALSVDHDHSNGKVRGLLCSVCNTNLGIIENKEFAQQAQNYLKMSVIFMNKYTGNINEGGKI